ncbi:MAG: hypothetical protein ACYSWP_07560 [Planctomycetota bacterium]|jgi:hypothetical protein
MSYSKLKPYNLIGVQNKLDRLYGRKLSLRGYLSFAARYLKEKGKESVYEKPYLQTSRPQMHQDWATPDWYITPPPVGAYPPGDPKYHRYIFSPGLLSIFIQGPAQCDEESVRGFAGISLQGPHNRDARNEWSFSSSDERVRVTNVQFFPPVTQHSADFDVEFDQVDENLDVQICATVSLAGGLLREATGPMTGSGAVQVPHPGALGVPGSPPTVPLQAVKIWQGYNYPVECGDLTIESCECTEATWTSGDDVTVGQSSSVSVSISTPTSGTKTWTVSGSGFYLNAELTSTTLVTSSNTVFIYTNSEACGLCTVEVCNVTGYVRSTTGHWEYGGDTCGGGGGTWDTKSCRFTWPNYHCTYERIGGGFKNRQQVASPNWPSGGQDTCLTPVLCEDILGGGWETISEWMCFYDDTYWPMNNVLLQHYTWEC